eukprot:CAMPEP_0172478536 /NCGR_PEP_ID=MMETSP1066-20121228/2560_1 /TAXON_ID=671091 /ORGANISM="Coscinodiscus wailesii, Strain CCMP2513" /LENGTH=284 /DNA_ID=CAMNT_0013238195 /DNA_START=176 /DNA_END=1030 /DNA_ORIENTATION=+
MKWRDNDIVVTVPPKSGTTWAMNIVYQLREGGDAEFDCLYSEVPWIEFVPRPEISTEDAASKLDDMEDNKRRIFKTHMFPPILPYLNTETSLPAINVKYVVILRNPEEAVASFKPFMEKHTDEFLNYWNVPPLKFDDFETFYNFSVNRIGLLANIFGFMAAWWPLRKNSNVLMLHFSDMKKDHEGCVRKIADFVGFEPTDEQWENILDYTSFKWMSERHGKFNAKGISHVPILHERGLIRRGLSGVQYEDGMTEDIASDIKKRGKEILPDEAAFEWIYSGGPLS